MPISTPGRALGLVLPAVLLASAGQAQERPPALGLCATNAARLDSYLQALCDGERALRADDAAAAIVRFRFAASLPRVDATNELAWAGLAAAHCHASEFDSAAKWSESFTQARQLWLGELDCNAPADDPRGRLSPFVRSRMCAEHLVADYALLRDNPTASYAIELKLRMKQVAEALSAACAPAASATTQSAATPVKDDASEATKTEKKRGKRKKARSGTSRAKTN